MTLARRKAVPSNFVICGFSLAHHRDKTATGTPYLHGSTSVPNAFPNGARFWRVIGGVPVAFIH
jgi:hypothetical protein